MKRALVIWLCVSALGFGGLFLTFRDAYLPPDTVALNDAVMTVLQADDGAEAARMLTEELERVYSGMDAARRDRNRMALIYLYFILSIYTAAGVWLIWYCERGVLSPFRKLQYFAQNVAAGNLDVPLAMDRRGAFGAFTESFDLMRVELKRARENERNANQSKRELVASLSHDIKTPIASIKAVVELMLAKSPDNIEQLLVIMSKADQIDLLITNMFHAALEELEQLKVAPTEHPSTVLYEMIQSADYDRKVKEIDIPECVISVDRMRLQQVLDNIISNSYKYAGTDIKITSYFEGQHLAIEVIDTGPGVKQDELPLIFEKYYRGGNADKQSGAGLGLYIAKYLMGKMDGDIQCEQNRKEFAVKILLSM